MNIFKSPFKGKGSGGFTARDKKILGRAGAREAYRRSGRATF